MEQLYVRIKETARLSMKIVLFMCFALSWANPLSAQQCYQPISGPGVSVAAVTPSGLCVTQLCLGNNYTALQKIVDQDLNSYAEWGGLASLLTAEAISVKSSTPYPAGYVTGYVFSKASLVDLNVLNGATIVTYLNGAIKETKSLSSLVSASLLGSSGRIFATFITTQSFDEVRLVTGALSASVLSDFRVYAALAFDQNCNMDNTSICMRNINGPGTYTTYNGNMVCLGCSLLNPDNLVDANKANYSVLSMPANLLSSVSVGVLDTRKVFKAGDRAGFIISPNTSNGLLDLDLLQSITIETWKFGTLQESQTFSGSSSGLLNLSLLGGGLGNEKRQKLGFVTTKSFNEVRIKVSQAASVSLAAIRLYGAFVEPSSCTECKDLLTTAAPGKYKAKIRTSETQKYGIGLGGGLSNANRVINTNSNEYATISYPILAVVNNGARITVETDNGQKFAGGTFAGFTVQANSSLLSLALLDGLSITAYNGTTPVGTASGSNLLGLSLLGGGSGKTVLGIKPSDSFNCVRINVDFGLLSANLGGSLFVYDLHVIEDDDNDGTPNCIDQCPGFSDDMDTNGSGIPDPCDNPGADLVNSISLTDTSIKFFYAGDSLSYTIKVKNYGPSVANTVNIINNAPYFTVNGSWTATATSGITLPALSGTGNINHTVPTIPVGGEIVYTVWVVTPVNYLGLDIKNKIEVTCATPDPDPTCAQCETPGLPRVITPDLVPTTNVPFSSFSSIGATRNMILTIQEIGEKSTDPSKEISVYISKSSNYTLSFDGTISSFPITGSSNVAVQNTSWTFDSSNPYFYVLKTKPSVFIAAQSFHQLGLTLTSQALGLGSISIVNINISPNSGGEKNSLNNSTSFKVTFD